MSDPITPQNLHWSRGDVFQFLNNPSKDISKTIFALFYTADLQYTFEYLIKLLQKNDDATEKEYIKISIALIQFLAGAIADSENTLKAIKLELLKNPSGIGRDFFGSTYVHLFNLIKSNGSELELAVKSINSKSQSIHLIGDSHAISYGFICYLENILLRPIYLPGIKIRHLADPKPSIFKSGFANAMQLTSRDNITLFSFGEIDYRLSTNRKIGSTLKFGGNPQGKQLTNACVATEQTIAKCAVEFISQHRSISQQYAVPSPQPPNPNFVPESFDQQDLDAEVDLIKNVNDSIRFACKEFDLFFIDRTETLSSSDGLLDKAHLPDNKHIKYSVHKKILEDFLASVS